MATPTEAPLTFHGARFGRSVAGARTMAASMRHRPLPPGVAPSGLLLDATAIESVVMAGTPPPLAAPGVEPPTAPSAPGPVHRRAAPKDLVVHAELTTADADVGFAPPPERERPLVGASWSAEGGFVDAAVSAPADDPGIASLRYIAVAGDERPAADLVHLVTEHTGVHVGDATIDRSPAVADRAAQLGAIAFTEQATIHLPAELGGMDDPAVRAVVAHELTHVAQQRRGSSIPAEDSPAGRELEAEAQHVQRAAARGVRPHFQRRQPGSLGTPSAAPAGVQRLADDEPYAWQDRDRDPSDARTAEMFGFGAFGVVAGAIDRHREAGGERAWAREFEQRHADRLERLRTRRYEELREEAERELRVDALRRDEAPGSLDRDAVIDLRRRLDEEMPWQFGSPHPDHAYPDPLPPADDDASRSRVNDRDRDRDGGHDEHGDDRHDDRGDDDQHDGTAPGRHRDDAPASGGARRLRSSRSGPTGPRGGARRRSAHHAGRGGRGDDPYEWQHREPTEQGAVTALLGGGLLGDLIGRAIGPETATDRAEAEAATPRLHERRREHERELRHARLIDKRAQQLREDEHPTDADRPVALTRDEVVEIREQLDADMPLQYAEPQYLDTHEAVTLDPQGNLAAGELAPDEPERGPDHHPAGRSTPATGSSASTTTAATTAAAAPTTTPSDEAAGTPASPASSAAAVGSAGGGLTHAAAGAVIAHAAQAAHDAHHDEHAGHAEAARLALAHATELDIDLLSRRVWQRIRRELRSELIVDRERAGALADAR